MTPSCDARPAGEDRNTQRLARFSGARYVGCGGRARDLWMSQEADGDNHLDKCRQIDQYQREIDEPYGL